MGCSRARSGASLAVAGVLLAGVSARGDVILWTNPSGANWLNANNWNGTVVPDGDDTAQFGVDPTSSTTGLGINFNNTTNNGPGNQIVGAVQINSIRSNNLLIGNSSTTAGANGTFTLAGQTISGIPNTIIRHAGGTVASPSTLTFQNTQGSGNQLMSLELLPANSIIQIFTGNSGLTGGSQGNTVLISSNIGGAAKAITVLGGGNINNFGGTLSLSGTNTFSGGITLGNADGTQTARLLLSSAAALPTAGNFTVNPHSQMLLTASGTYGSASQTATLNSLGQSVGVPSINGALRFAPTGGAPGTATFLPAIVLAGESAIHVVNNTQTLTLSGPISGGFGISKTGLGILELGGASSYTGDTIIRGTVRLVGGDDRLPGTTRVELGQPSSANLGVLDLNGFDQTIAGLSSITGTNASAAKNTVTSAGAAILTLGGSGSYSFGSGSAANSGAITGAISLVKSGSGTQVLGDASTYTGSTTITGGTLALGAAGSIDNSQLISLEGGSFDVSAKSSYAVASGATLRGGGTVAGASSTTTIDGGIQVGTTHAASGSAVALTVTSGQLVLAGEALFDLFTAAEDGSADTLTATALTYGGVLKVSNQTGGALAGGMSWDLFDFGGAAGGSFANSFGSVDANLPGLGSGLEWAFDSGTGVLSVIPEPAGAVFLSLVGLMLLRRRADGF